MKKYFYSHIITIDTLTIHLDSLDLSKEEKEELIDLADEQLHHAIIDKILSELQEEDKRHVLSVMAQNDHDVTWKIITEKVPNAEEIVRKVAEELMGELKADIEEVKHK
jgi:hypothetical protein